LHKDLDAAVFVVADCTNLIFYQLTEGPYCVVCL